LQSGVTEFVIHLGFADDELKSATRERDTWAPPGASAISISLPARNFATARRAKHQAHYLA